MTREMREDRLDINRKFLTEIQALYVSDRGKIATLKRNSGNTMTEGRGLNWFYLYLMRHFANRSARDNNLCVLVASLMSFDRETMLHGLRPAMPSDFGCTLAVLRSPEERAVARPGQTPLERRLVGLLDSTFDDDGNGEMAYRLRQTVKFALSRQAPIDWPQLLEDLRGWSHPDKYVQKRWARGFYAVSMFEIPVATGESLEAASAMAD